MSKGTIVVVTVCSEISGSEPFCAKLQKAAHQIYPDQYDSYTIVEMPIDQQTIFGVGGFAVARSIQDRARERGACLIAIASFACNEIVAGLLITLGNNLPVLHEDRNSTGATECFAPMMPKVIK